MQPQESRNAGIDRRWEVQLEAEEAALAADVQALRSDVLDQGSRFASLPHDIEAVKITPLTAAPPHVPGPFIKPCIRVPLAASYKPVAAIRKSIATTLLILYVWRHVD